MMGRVPIVSVVIPTHNRGDKVVRAVRSALQQTLSDIEVIVIDDGSTDNTIHLLEQLSDPRLRVIALQRNCGGSRARNRGIDEARGRYIAFLDSDDYWSHKKLEKCLSCDLSEGELLFSGCYVVSDGGIRRVHVAEIEDEGPLLYVMRHRSLIQTSTIVMATASARKVRFTDGLKKHQDWDFCIRAHASGVQFRSLNEPLVYWDCTSAPKRVSKNVDPRFSAEWISRMRLLVGEDAYWLFLLKIVVPQYAVQGRLAWLPTWSSCARDGTVSLYELAKGFARGVRYAYFRYAW